MHLVFCTLILGRVLVPSTARVVFTRVIRCSTLVEGNSLNCPATVKVKMRNPVEKAEVTDEAAVVHGDGRGCEAWATSAWMDWVAADDPRMEPVTHRQTRQLFNRNCYLAITSASCVVPLLPLNAPILQSRLVAVHASLGFRSSTFGEEKPPHHILSASAIGTRVPSSLT